MCGIIGEISADPIDITTFELMRDELSHRGPDGEGLYLDDSETVALGHRRLSIIDLSSAGNQPMANEDETVWLVFNGEIYNYQKLRSILETEGHEFKSDTDSEVILHGYEEWGTACVENLRGMFSFGVWDETSERLFLARDRLGIKPLHYFVGNERFLFASELKAIVKDEHIDRRINPVGLRHYLRYRYIPAPYTIWNDMYKLEPGHTLLYQNGEYTINQYWSPYEYIRNDMPDEQTIQANVKQYVTDAVRSHLVSDVEIGVLLSGGLDSSIISALASSSLDEITAFSMGFDVNSPDELQYAETVAETFDLNHRTDILSLLNMDELLDEILYYYDEPLADSSIFPTYMLMQNVSSEVKVALSGDGGDEIFAGYTWYDDYLFYQKLNFLQPGIVPLVALMSELETWFDSNLLNAVNRRFKPFVHTGIDRYQQIMYPSFEDDELNQLLSEEYLTDGFDDVPARHCDEDMGIKEMQLLDMNSFLVADILTKVDQASMANSLEVRVPFLDHELVEYMLSIDDEWIYKNKEKKFLLKQLGREFLPESIINRPKSGFGAPLKAFGFVDQYKDVLLDSEAARDGIFTQKYLAELVDSGIAYNKLVRLVLFELWYRRWRQPT